MGSQYEPEDKQAFINCKLAFKCTKNWYELEPTYKAGIKHCHHCEEDVRLCMTQKELDIALERKYCIAYFKDASHSTWFKLNREKCEANARDPEFEPLMLVGYPSEE